MAPNFQSSFIPKEPVVAPEVFKKKKAGIVGILAVSLFLSSIIISVFMYIYKDILRGDIQNLESQLAESEKNIDQETINNLVGFSQKLVTAKSIISRHQVVSKTLETLASSTVSSVQFDSFSYGNIEKNRLSLSIKGKALGYASIALQEDVLYENKYFKYINFENLDLDSKGMVSFELNIEVDPQIANYSLN